MESNCYKVSKYQVPLFISLQTNNSLQTRKICGPGFTLSSIDIRSITKMINSRYSPVFKLTPSFNKVFFEHPCARLMPQD